jgi:hypothetical protein
LEHFADVAIQYLQESDGVTGYELWLGKTVHEESFEFGECILWREHRTQDRSRRLSSGWGGSVALQCIVCLVCNEVLEVRAVQQKPAAECWDSTAVEGVKAFPWRTPAPDEVEPVRVLHRLGNVPAEQARVRPGVRLKRVSFGTV